MRSTGHARCHPRPGRKESRVESSRQIDTARSTPTPPRAVLDTDLVLSAPVFSAGALVPLRRGWQGQRFTPPIPKATAGELIRVLAYPKCRLSNEEREGLLSDYLPFCESVQVPNPPPPTPSCRDPFDVPFVELALAGEAEFLVTGNRDLLSLAAQFPCPIVNAGTFLQHPAAE